MWVLGEDLSSGRVARQSATLHVNVSKIRLWKKKENFKFRPGKLPKKKKKKKKKNLLFFRFEQQENMDSRRETETVGPRTPATPAEGPARSAMGAMGGGVGGAAGAGGVQVGAGVDAGGMLVDADVVVGPEFFGVDGGAVAGGDGSVVALDGPAGVDIMALDGSYVWVGGPGSRVDHAYAEQAVPNQDAWEGSPGGSLAVLGLTGESDDEMEIEFPPQPFNEAAPGDGVRRRPDGSGRQQRSRTVPEEDDEHMVPNLAPPSHAAVTSLTLLRARGGCAWCPVVATLVLAGLAAGLAVLAADTLSVDGDVCSAESLRGNALVRWVARGPIALVRHLVCVSA
eukprot:TRINITY_DN8745_c1_g1_i1.p2 TRINITY_DN8745_c1_g1~~TRINITY_DN8745_c1_g1_i1.p2  ORF type:complete len:340 (+),score=81.56 TRINITY_DN8745_c1_g1_i1:87-1106(+)